MSAPALPPRLAELVEEFGDVGPSDRLQLLLELSQELPPHVTRDSMQRVPECQSPLLLAVEVGNDQCVHLYFDAPLEAPTTRGLAAVLHTGLDGEAALRAGADELVSEDLPHGRRFDQLQVRNPFPLQQGAPGLGMIVCA